MNKEQKKDLLRAVLTGDRATVNRLTKDKTIWFKDSTSYYLGNLETSVSKEQFEAEFRSGFDTLIEFPDVSEQARLMAEFGATPEEIAALLDKTKSPAQTVNEILTLKNKLENE